MQAVYLLLDEAALILSSGSNDVYGGAVIANHTQKLKIGHVFDE